MVAAGVVGHSLAHRMLGDSRLVSIALKVNSDEPSRHEEWRSKQKVSDIDDIGEFISYLL